MIDAYTFNVCTDILCLFLTLVLLYHSYAMQSWDGRRRVYAGILALFFLAAGGNLISLVCSYNAGGSESLLSVAASMVSGSAGALFIPGLCAYLYSGENGFRKPQGKAYLILNAVRIICVICIFIILLRHSVVILGGVNHASTDSTADYYIFTIIQIFLLILLIFMDDELRERKIEIVIYFTFPLIASILGLCFPRYIFIYTMTAITLLLVYINYQLRVEDTLIKRDLELTDLQMSILLSQIKPHFIFNVLNSIYYLCESDPSKSAEAVNDFNEYLKTNILETDSIEPIQFEKELHHVKLYERLQKMRFDQINVEYDIQETGFMIPALTVQPLVENAFRHAYKESEIGTVTVASSMKGDHYEITVSDKGTGFDPEHIPSDHERHVGLENVRRRLDMIKGASLAVHSGPKGTQAVISIPLSQRIIKDE